MVTSPLAVKSPLASTSVPSFVNEVDCTQSLPSQRRVLFAAVPSAILKAALAAIAASKSVKSVVRLVLPSI